jgi:hypothetical protein
MGRLVLKENKFSPSSPDFITALSGNARPGIMVDDLHVGRFMGARHQLRRDGFHHPPHLLEDGIQVADAIN